jgi:hypothetical protein
MTGEVVWVSVLFGGSGEGLACCRLGVGVKMEDTQCSKTLAIKHHAPGNYLKD